MKVFKHHFYARAGWIQRPLAAHSVNDWLLEPASLTQRLIALGQGFHVQQIFQGKRKANFDEANVLGINPRDEVFLREVLLFCGHQPVVFAHSITAMASLRHSWKSLQGLGNQSLGNMLFNNPKVRRTAFQFKKLNPHHPLMRRMNQIQKLRQALDSPRQSVWARRSQFFMQEQSSAIMVTEVFLPSLSKLDHKDWGQ